MSNVPAGQELARRLALLVARSRARSDGATPEGATALLSELTWACANTPPAITEAAIAALTEDSQPRTRAAAVQGLQQLLRHVDDLSRTELVARWASSNHSLQRAAMALALQSDLEVLGTIAALDCLARDDAPAVRAAAYATAAFRIEAGSDELSGVLWRGARDPDDDARASAIDGMKRLAQHGSPPTRDEARRLLEAL